jgi:hypothetical protein
VSKIYLIFNVWISENQFTLFGIVAYYLDGKTWKNQSRLIILRKIKISHISENIAIYFIQIVNEYEITDKLDFFTLDNAESNDIYLRTFFRISLSNITDEAIKLRRIRYFGYVVNLAAKAFLFGENADAFEMDNIRNIIFDR